MKQQSRYDAIVFDLGGVVIDLDRELCLKAFEQLGYPDIRRDLDLYVQRGPFYGLECGHTTAASFYDEMRARCVEGTSDKDIQDAFEAFLVSLPAERLKALRCLRERYRIFALSNTNPVMYHGWIDRAFRQEGLAINDYFEGIIASFQEGCCKPDADIFRILLRRYSLSPRRTLYLDDSEKNCEAAAALGIQTALVTAEHDMLAIIARL